jgi:hypothetical protein
VGEKEEYTGLLLESGKQRYLGDLDVPGNIILKVIVKEFDVRIFIRFNWRGLALMKLRVT